MMVIILALFSFQLPPFSRHDTVPSEVTGLRQKAGAVLTASLTYAPRGEDGGSDLIDLSAIA